MKLNFTNQELEKKDKLKALVKKKLTSEGPIEDLMARMIEQVMTSIEAELSKPIHAKPDWAKGLSVEVDLPSKGSVSHAFWEAEVRV
jgi:hypothetical protein